MYCVIKKMSLLEFFQKQIIHLKIARLKYALGFLSHKSF